MRYSKRAIAAVPMSTTKKFAPAEVEELCTNPYAENVSEKQISFALAFILSIEQGQAVRLRNLAER